MRRRSVVQAGRIETLRHGSFCKRRLGLAGPSLELRVGVADFG
jgi:hypothetical protein